LLTGKYRPGAIFASNDVRSKFDAEKMKRDLAEVARLKKEEVPAGTLMGDWALTWCLKAPVVSSVICGCKNPDQVRMNAGVAELATG
jgi:aryl-alcohol dehydrogenase-like predicted oxidoreductase